MNKMSKAARKQAKLKADERSKANIEAELLRLRRQRLMLVTTSLIVGLGLAITLLLVSSSSKSTSNKNGQSKSQSKSQYPFVVGTPGPGDAAPNIDLPATSGGRFNLKDARGKTVLLYFQEGVMCQPCWDQIKDMEMNWGKFKSIGIDEVVSITVDPLDALKRKTKDEGLSTILLSDKGASLGSSYTANKYTMMGDRYYGHTFILVNPEGQITWRGDYGGPQTGTIMYVPIPNLLKDLKEKKTSSSPGADSSKSNMQMDM